MAGPADHSQRKPPLDRNDEPSPEDASPHTSISNRQLLRWMFGFVKPVKWLAVISCTYLTLGILAEIKTVNYAGEVVNSIQHLEVGTTHSTIWAWIVSDDPAVASVRRSMGWLLLFVVGMLVLRFLREVANSRFSMSMVYHLREAVYDKLQRVGFGFHDSISTGQLINRSLSDLQNVRGFVQTAIFQSLEIVLVVVGFIGLILTIAPTLALLALVPLPIWTWYILRFSKRVQPVARTVMEAEDKNVSIITENIAGVHVVKAFATEDREVMKYNTNADEFKGRVLRRIRMFANFHPVIRLIASASHLSLFLLAGGFIIVSRGNDLGVGDLMKLGGAMGAILGRLQGIATINEQYQNAIVSARRLHEVLSARPTVPERPDAVDLPIQGNGEVIFERVCFGYDAAKPVLHDIDLKVPGGSVIAIVGPTGSGKTTLVNLLARYYDPTAGRILVDGVDVRDLKLSSLRSNVGFVFQETYLFSDTVKANIAYGRPHISDGDIEAAARLAQAHEFIEQLPDGYNTVIGERGASLSGGQRQRLAIARAVVTNPRILVLDDATAAVDPETEDLIRRGMKFVMAGRTTFVIAHRVTTLRQADFVIVLENGRITQMGTHEELVVRDGHYREVVLAQIGAGEPGEDDPSHMKRVRDRRRVDQAKASAVAASEPDHAEPPREEVGP